MPETDRPGYSFDPGPPPEASRFLRNKGLTPSFSWRDVEPEEHATAFTVAKGMQTDVLEAIRGEVQTALDDGLPFAEFQKRLRPRLQELGWWGKAQMTDPVTGELVEAQLGSPRRLRTIYRANIRSARAAGQWERIERTKDALPYLQYNLGPSERHRPHHAAKEGMVLPVDDPFWDAWMPPNGWGCKCWVRQITAREARRTGINDSPDVQLVEKRNRRTGEVRDVPEGIDPGWERNPGKLRRENVERLLRDKLVAADPNIAQTVARDVASSWMTQRMLAGEVKGSVPVATLSQSMQDALGAKTPIVQLRDDIAAKIRKEHPEVTTETLTRFVDAIDIGPAAIETKDGRETLLFMVPGEKPWMLAIKSVTEKGELWISTAHRTEQRKWRAKLKRDGIRKVRD